MKRPQHSGHPPWGKPLHLPATPAAQATVWQGLNLKLAPKGKRFRMGELVAGEFTLPAAIDLRNYRVQLNYSQRVVSKEAERVHHLASVEYLGEELARTSSHSFRFNRPVGGMNYRSTEVSIAYYVELLVYRSDALALPITTRRASISVLNSGITYAVEPTVLPLAPADAGTALAATVGVVFVLAAMLIFSPQLALWFGLLVGLPLLLQGLHYGLQQQRFGRASIRIGRTRELYDIQFDTDGKPALLDATLTLRVQERYTRTDHEGNVQRRRREVYSQSTHLLDAVAAADPTAENSFRVPLPSPDSVLPTSATTQEIACYWQLIYTHHLPYWPLPLRRRWPVRVGMKGRQRP